MSAVALPAGTRAPGMEQERTEWGRIWPFAIALTLIVLYPWVDIAFHWQTIRAVIPIMLFVLLAMGLNIVVGYAGLLDLGYAAFFAIGAYTTAFLTSPASPIKFAAGSPFAFLQDFWVAMVLAVVVAAILGIILGAPTLRLRGDYLAIVTLGFGEIVPRVVLNLEQWTKGSKGMNPIGRPHLFGCQFGLDPCTVFGQKLTLGALTWYYLIVVVGLVSVVAITRLRSSRLGRAWAAIRDDETAAVSMGINPVTTKLLAFALGASFSGFGGAIYAAYLQFIDPGQFDFSISVLVLCMVILGGTGNIYGVMLGGLIISSFDRIFAERLSGWLHSLGDVVGTAGTFSYKTAIGPTPINLAFSLRGWLKSVDLLNARLLIFGLSLVLLMLLRPQGILPARRRRMARPDFAAAAEKAEQIEQEVAATADDGAATEAAAPTYLQSQTAEAGPVGTPARETASADQVPPPEGTAGR